MILLHITQRLPVERTNLATTIGNQHQPPAERCWKLSGVGKGRPSSTRMRTLTTAIPRAWVCWISGRFGRADAIIDQPLPSALRSNEPQLLYRNSPIK